MFWQCFPKHTEKNNVPSPAKRIKGQWQKTRDFQPAQGVTPLQMDCTATVINPAIPCHFQHSDYMLIFSPY